MIELTQIEVFIYLVSAGVTVVSAYLFGKTSKTKVDARILHECNKVITMYGRLVHQIVKDNGPQIVSDAYLRIIEEDPEIL